MKEVGKNSLSLNHYINQTFAVEKDQNSAQTNLSKKEAVCISSISSSSSFSCFSSSTLVLSPSSFTSPTPSPSRFLFSLFLPLRISFYLPLTISSVLSLFSGGWLHSQTLSICWQNMANSNLKPAPYIILRACDSRGKSKNVLSTST